MPISKLQSDILRLIASKRDPESFVAGGVPINRAGPRYSGPTLPQGTNAVPDFIPVARFTDMLLNPGGKTTYNGKEITYPDIKLV